MVTLKSIAASAVGVVKEGLLNVCPEKGLLPGCASSQDDRPGYFYPPWTYDGDYKLARNKLKTFMQDTYDVSIKNDQKEVTLVKEEDRYLTTSFPSKAALKEIKEREAW